MRGCRTKLTAAILLVLALIPAVSVVCVSSDHVDFESLFALCCGPQPGPQGSPLQESVGSVGHHCSCEDLPFLAAVQLTEFRVFRPDNNVWSSPVPSPVILETTSPTAVVHGLGPVSLPAASISAPNPLRC